MISIVITVRERYAFTKKSISSILSGLPKNVEVIFVADKAPPEILTFLQETSRKRKGFQWVAVDRFLRPTEVRKVALERVNRKNDLVFIENDVVARKGWLKEILRCARETGAGIVAPLIFEGDPDKKSLRFHIAGADFKRDKTKGRDDWEMEHYLSRQEADWRKLKRRIVDVVEFHCLFIRRKLLDKIGLGGGLDSFVDYVDLCLEAKKLGAKIIVEPKAHVVFLNPTLVPIDNRPDFECFAAKWSEKVIRESIDYAAKKLGMSPRGQFLWMFRYWAFWNKSLVFSSLGVLTRPELFFWRAIRVKICPEWVRAILEKYLVARIRARI